MSLQVLNEYIDRLSRGKPLSQQHVEFCAVAGDHISTIEAVLPASGNLGPLFHAFGLISEAESVRHTASPGLMYNSVFKLLLPIVLLLSNRGTCCLSDLVGQHVCTGRSSIHALVSYLTCSAAFM